MTVAEALAAAARRSLTAAAGPAEATRASTEGRSEEATVAADAAPPEDDDETDATETIVLESALLAAAAEAVELANAAVLSTIAEAGRKNQVESTLSQAPRDAGFGKKAKTTSQVLKRKPKTDSAAAPTFFFSFQSVSPPPSLSTSPPTAKKRNVRPRPRHLLRGLQRRLRAQGDPHHGRRRVHRLAHGPEARQEPAQRQGELGVEREFFKMFASKAAALFAPFRGLVPLFFICAFAERLWDTTPCCSNRKISEQRGRRGGRERNRSLFSSSS